jgi:hypothetical protein
LTRVPVGTIHTGVGKSSQYKKSKYKIKKSIHIHII